MGTRHTIAVAGAAVAITTAALMTAGVAAAATPGRCAENVNVRAEPSIDAAIVAVCPAGTTVTTGRVTDGFVRLGDLDGWAAAEYVEIDGRRAGAPGSTPAPRTLLSEDEDPGEPPAGRPLDDRDEDSDPEPARDAPPTGDGMP